jgi:Ca2+-binding EF-hand superfamily protein
MFDSAVPLRRFDGERLEVGDTIVSVDGVAATPDNIDDLLCSKSSGASRSEVTILIRKGSPKMEGRSEDERISEEFRQLDHDDSGKLGREIAVKLERGGAGAFMRFTSLVSELAEAKKMLTAVDEQDLRAGEHRLPLLPPTHRYMRSLCPREVHG